MRVKNDESFVGVYSQIGLLDNCAVGCKLSRILFVANKVDLLSQCLRVLDWLILVQLWMLNRNVVGRVLALKTAVFLFAGFMLQRLCLSVPAAFGSI